jgi:hypothetical protein
MEDKLELRVNGEKRLTFGRPSRVCDYKWAVEIARKIDGATIHQGSAKIWPEEKSYLDARGWVI